MFWHDDRVIESKDNNDPAFPSPYMRVYGAMLGSPESGVVLTVSLRPARNERLPEDDGWASFLTDE